MSPPGQSCAVIGCPKPGVERHHFFPVALRGRTYADRWPTALLCRDHHRLWHQLLTPAAFDRRLTAIREAKVIRARKLRDALTLEALPLFGVLEI